MPDAMAVRGVFFPCIIDPDVTPDKRFNMRFVPRTIRSRVDNSTEEVFLQVKDIVENVIANPTDTELANGFFPVDSSGIEFNTVTITYDDQRTFNRSKLEVVLDGLSLEKFVSQKTYDIFILALIESLWQLGVSGVGITSK